MLGWVEDLGDGCLGLDPGLAPYLRGEHDPATLDGLRARWADATTALTDFLYQQKFQETGWAAGVTQRLLPELLALLDWDAAHQLPEQVVPLATRIEGLVRDLGQPRAITRAARTRTEAAARLGAWSHARYHRAIAQRTPEQSARDLATLLEPDTPPRITALVHTLQAPPPTQCTRTRPRARRGAGPRRTGAGAWAHRQCSAGKTLPASPRRSCGALTCRFR